MSKQLKILLLEDNEDDVIFIEHELSKAGFSFVPLVVDKKSEFEQALKTFRPDVILSDHALPEFNSAEALKIYQLEKQKKQLNAPFILVTGAVSEEFAVQCIKNGASDYILKDRLKRLPSAINSALEKQRSELDKKRSEIEKELVLSISKIFSSINTLEKDLEMSLVELCHQYDIDAAEAWITSIDTSYLKLAASYSLNETLQYPNENDYYLNVEGLIGTAWTQKNNIFSNEIQQDNGYIRKEFAKVNKLSSVLAVPVMFRNEVMAVFSFYSRQPKNAASDIVAMGNNLLSQLASDIRRKKTEVELNNFFTLSPDIICIASTDGCVKKINPAATAIMGYKEEEILSRPYISFVHPEDHELTAFEIAKLHSGLAHNYFENRLITINGDIKWLAWTLIPVENNALIYAIGKDITEKKEDEEKLRLLYEELNNAKLKKQQEITSAVIAAQESERQEIGRELHDNINQILVSSRLHIGIYKMDPADKGPFLDKAEELIDTSVREIRALSHKLIAPSLQENSFTYVIKDLAIELQSTTKLQVHCQLHLPNESKVHDKLKLNLYRIIQEQLQNIVKYAKATNVIIKLNQGERRLVLKISDDGIGFDTTKKPKGVGLLNMQTRVSEFNGELIIISAPQKGCTIEVLVPLSKTHEQLSSAH